MCLLSRRIPFLFVCVSFCTHRVFIHHFVYVQIIFLQLVGFLPRSNYILISMKDAQKVAFSKFSVNPVDYAKKLCQCCFLLLSLFVSALFFVSAARAEIVFVFVIVPVHLSEIIKRLRTWPAVLNPLRPYAFCALLSRCRAIYSIFLYARSTNLRSRVVYVFILFIIDNENAHCLSQ